MISGKITYVEKKKKKKIKDEKEIQIQSETINNMNQVADQKELCGESPKKSIINKRLSP